MNYARHARINGQIYICIFDVVKNIDFVSVSEVIDKFQEFHVESFEGCFRITHPACVGDYIHRNFYPQLLEHIENSLRKIVPTVDYKI